MGYTYIHGSYGTLESTQDVIPTKVGTLPVYFGRLPIHQLADFKGKVNKPLLVRSFYDAKKLGYNDVNWEDFDLCEAVYAHFKNDIKVVGPIVLVNVLDPETMKKTGQKATVKFTNRKAYITNDKVILNTIKIDSKILGVDYLAEYTADGTRVLISDIKGDLKELELTFDEVNPTVTEDEVIGGTSSLGIKTGISVVDLVYQTHNLVPTILDAPAFSHIPKVAEELKEKSKQINGHWYAWVNSNLVADANVNTIEKALEYKKVNGYNSAIETACWPMALCGKRKFHLSTLTTVAMQQTDYKNGNTPYETPSNKPIPITGLCLKDGTPIEFDKIQANELNSKGIKTAIYWGGKWVLWGPHTAAYEYGKEMDPRDKFDCNIRMLHYMLNDFQKRYGIEVDKPMTRSKIETILNDYQERIDTLINRGALLYGKIQFNETSNEISDIVEGDFNFDIATTVVPPGKSISATLQYTTKGIYLLFGGGK